MSEEKPNPTPLLAAPPLLTLDYLRLERARKVAIGGLRLLGILISVIAVIPLILVAIQLHSISPTFIRPAIILPLAILGIVFSLGITKFVCSLFISRRSRTAAIVALLVVLIECLGILFGLFPLAMALLKVADEPFAFKVLIISLLCFVLLGWLAVAYEILQILRLEKKSNPS